MSKSSRTFGVVSESSVYLSKDELVEIKEDLKHVYKVVNRNQSISFIHKALVKQIIEVEMDDKTHEAVRQIKDIVGILDYISSRLCTGEHIDPIRRQAVLQLKSIIDNTREAKYVLFLVGFTHETYLNMVNNVLGKEN